MDMRFLTRALLVAAACLAGTPAGGADRVELKTGDVFSGKILRETRDEVAIQISGGGVLTFKSSLVKRLRRSGADSTEEEAPAPAEKAPQEGGAPGATKREPDPQAAGTPIPGPPHRVAAPGAAPIPLATTAAGLVMPPRLVRTPWAATLP